MAIKITKGGITTECEPFDLDFYKRTGWQVVGEQPPAVEESPTETEPEDAEPVKAEKKSTKK